MPKSLGLLIGLLHAIPLIGHAENAPSTPTPDESRSTPVGLRKVDQWLDQEIPDFLSEGRLILHARPRYKHADQEGLDPSNAFTVRSRIGFETAPLYDFTALAEIEDVTILGNDDNFNQAGLSGPGRTVIADPETTEINRARLAYNRFDSTLALGRQRIILDNARFVGNVGWRQNEQTYDAASLETEAIPHVTAAYHYLLNVNRVFGDDHPQGDWRSDSHLLNIAYSPVPWGKWTAYSYLLDLEEAPALSSASVGLRFSGRQSLSPAIAIEYAAEYAWQTDYADNPSDYQADYYHLELLAEFDRYRLGAGYEVLGSDAGQGFSTPLATLHAFNGWADAFLTTPGRGLRDAYAQAGVDLPYSIPLDIIYHELRSDSGARDFGRELDVVLSRDFGRHFTALAKWATYQSGSDGPADRDKLWLQLSFDY